MRGRREDPAADYILYCADTPNSWKVATLLEELELDYEYRPVDLMKEEQKDPAYTKLNPNARTPTLVSSKIGLGKANSYIVS